MEVRIGVVYTPKEIVVETTDDQDAVTATVDAALRDDDAVLWLTDDKGRRVGVPSSKVAYVELGSEAGKSQVGFGPR